MQCTVTLVSAVPLDGFKCGGALPSFRVVLSPTIALNFRAVPRTSIARTASGWDGSVTNAACAVIVESHPVHHGLFGLLSGGEFVAMRAGDFQPASKALDRRAVPAIALTVH